MLELTLVAPAATAPPESFRDNAILWCAEAKPLPAAMPSDDNVQEVVVSPGTPDELRLVFDAFERAVLPVEKNKVFVAKLVTG